MAKNLETDYLVDALNKIDTHLIKSKKEPVTTETLEENRLYTLLNQLKSDWINGVHGYFINHRPHIPYSDLDDEYKIQDLVFILASSIISDLHYENPQSKNTGALTSTRIDFTSSSEKLFIEIKHASDKHKAKKIEKEISEDIIKYGKGKKFEHLLFFIYCHNYKFPNAKDFEKNFSAIEIISGHKINTYCIIKP